MSKSGLVANPDKTHFLMFSSKGQEPIKVGNESIKESEKEKLVGITVSKSLRWSDHVEELEKDLRVRIGVLRRLSWHLPRSALLGCLNAVFTSKLSYSLELVSDYIKHEDSAKSSCDIINRLQRLQSMPGCPWCETV